MQNSMKLILSGIFIMVLSGLEKILIYMAHQGQGVHDNTSLINLTPSDIWRIPQLTFAFGIVILVCGIVSLIVKSSFVRTQLELIKKRNEEFERRFNQDDNA
jgi:hypothetical protein